MTISEFILGIGASYIAIVAIAYFLPTTIALFRGRRNTAAIFALNLFLGWSLIGWVVALVWALTSPHVDQPTMVHVSPSSSGQNIQPHMATPVRWALGLVLTLGIAITLFARSPQPDATSTNVMSQQAGAINGPVTLPANTKNPIQEMIVVPPLSKNTAGLSAAAQERISSAAIECRTKRLAGQLISFEESARCSNSVFDQEYKKMNYRYPDLVVWYTQQRIEMARAMDRGQLSEAQAALEDKKWWEQAREEEQRRDSAR